MALVTQRGQPREYRDEATGDEFYSVTQIRTVAHDPYAGLAASILEPARQRGALLHRRWFFALASLAGHCDAPRVIPALHGYCASMDAWIAAKRPSVLALEQPGVNRRYRYAGTPDAVLLLTETVRKRSRARRTIVDLKTGARTKTDAMQLVAYSHLDEMQVEDLLDLYLDPDGGMPEERTYNNPGERAKEWAAFLAAAALLSWRIR